MSSMPDPPRAARRLRQAGIEELARRSGRGGVELVSTGATARGSPRPASGDAGRAGDRVPRVPRRPGQDAAPAVHAGILADLRQPEHVAQLEELGIAPFDLRGGQPLPVHGDGGLGRRAGRVRRADRHRRAGDGPRRREEPPLGGRRRRPRPLRRGARRRARRRVRRWPSGSALAAAAFRHTAAYDVAVASWMGNVLAARRRGTGFPAWVGGTWERGGVLRYGENPHQRAALYPTRTPRRARPRRAAARQGDVLQQLRRHRRRLAGRARPRRPCVAIIKHANPCGIAVGERRRRGAPQGPRLRPGCRPSAA